MNDETLITHSQRDFLRTEALTFVSTGVESDFFAGKRIAVTGATGMLGAWVVLLLAALQDADSGGPSAILPLVSAGSKRQALWSGLIHDKDITEWTSDTPPSQLPEADLYFHLASPASPNEHTSRPTANFRMNVSGSNSLLLKTGLVAGSRMVFASSGEIYGLAQGPLRESTVGSVPLGDPRWAYAESKRAAEALCIAHLAEFGTDSVVARLFHAFGPGLRKGDGRVFGDFISSLYDGRPLRIRNSADTRRTFCYAADAAKALLVISARGQSGEAYNIAGSESVSIAALAEELTKRFLPSGTAVISESGLGAGSSSNPSVELNPSIEKIALLGWQPSVNAADTFGKTLEFLRLA